MKIDVFCGWGDGPDVGINLTRTEEEAKSWADPHLHFFYDLTATEARAMSAQLIAAAEEAERLDKEYAEHVQAMYDPSRGDL